jgi:hypothetical protein
MQEQHEKLSDYFYNLVAKRLTVVRAKSFVRAAG